MLDLKKYSHELQSDHTHQSVRHRLVALELGGVRDQQLAVIEIDQRFVIEDGLGQLFADRLALRRIGNQARIFKRLVGLRVGKGLVLRRFGVQKPTRRRASRGAWR
jgi:hypothetical protein